METSYIECQITLDRIHRLETSALKTETLTQRTLTYLTLLKGLSGVSIEATAQPRAKSEPVSSNTNTVAMQNMKIKLADVTTKLKTIEIENQALKARLSSMDKVPVAAPKEVTQPTKPVKSLKKPLRNPKLSPLRKMGMLAGSPSRNALATSTPSLKPRQQPVADKVNKPSLFDSDGEPDHIVPDETFRAMFKPVSAAEQQVRKKIPKMRKLNNAFKKTITENDEEMEDSEIKSPTGKLRNEAAPATFVSPLRRRQIPSIFG